MAPQRRSWSGFGLYFPHLPFLPHSLLLASSCYYSFLISNSVKNRRSSCGGISPICPFKSCLDDVMVALPGCGIKGRKIKVAQSKGRRKSWSRGTRKTAGIDLYQHDQSGGASCQCRRKPTPADGIGH